MCYRVGLSSRMLSCLSNWFRGLLSPYNLRHLVVGGCLRLRGLTMGVRLSLRFCSVSGTMNVFTDHGISHTRTKYVSPETLGASTVISTPAMMFGLDRKSTLLGGHGLPRVKLLLRRHTGRPANRSSETKLEGSFDIQSWTPIEGRSGTLRTKSKR